MQYPLNLLESSVHKNSQGQPIDSVHASAILEWKWGLDGWALKIQQGRSQPHSPGWARVPLFSSNFHHVFLFSPHDFPHFGPCWNTGTNASILLKSARQVAVAPGHSNLNSKMVAVWIESRLSLLWLWFLSNLKPGGGHLYFRLDIILVKGLSKHTLNMYFLGMKIDPKYAFLHAFFLNLSAMYFPKLVNMTKNTPFFPILHVFAPLNDVRAYTAWSWKTTLITWIFLRGWYPTSNTSGPQIWNPCTMLKSKSFSSKSKVNI